MKVKEAIQVCNLEKVKKVHNQVGTIPFLSDKNTIASIWHENMLRYLSADIICSKERTVFCEMRGTDNVQGQISYHISAQMMAFVFIILQIFFPIYAVVKIGECSQIFPRFSWEYLVM